MKIKTEIFHGNDSALFFKGNGQKILVDGIYGGTRRMGESVRDLGMSDMPEEYLAMAEEGKGIFKSPDILLFTHTHRDHYNEALVSRYMSRFPGAKIFVPGRDESGLEPEKKGERCWSLKSGMAEISVLEADHLDLGESLRKFQNIENRSFIISFGEERFMVAGDSVLDESLLKVMKDNRLDNITYIFVNVIHLLIRKHIDFLKELKPGGVILYHLPEPEDDTMNYLRLAERAETRFPRELPPLMRAEHMSWLKL